MTRVWGKHIRDDEWCFVAEFVNEDDAIFFVDKKQMTPHVDWDYYIGPWPPENEVEND